MKHISKIKQEDRHILKGGRVLEGTKLKRDDRLRSRRTGTTVLFVGFTGADRVKVKFAGKTRTMSRKSLAGNYERAYGSSYGRW